MQKFEWLKLWNLAHWTPIWVPKSSKSVGVLKICTIQEKETLWDLWQVQEMNKEGKQERTGNRERKVAEDGKIDTSILKINS